MTLYADPAASPLSTGLELWHRFAVTSGPTHAVAAVAVDGRELVAATADSGFALWAPRGGARPVAHMAAELGPAKSLAVVPLPGVPCIAAADSDGVIEIWDVQERKRLRRWKQHKGTVLTTCPVLWDGHVLLASAGDDLVIRVRDVEKGTVFGELGGHLGPVTCLRQVTVDGRVSLASSGNDQQVRLWDLADLTECASLRGSARGTVWSLAAVPRSTGFFLASGGYGNVIRLWKPGYEADETELLGHSGTVRMMLTTSGPVPELVSVSDDHSVRVWNLADRKVSAIVGGLQSAVLCVTSAPESGRWLAAGLQDGSVVVMRSKASTSGARPTVKGIR